MKVSVLIPTHNRARSLIRVLDSIDRLDRPTGTGVELIVCANACSDGTVRQLAGRPTSEGVDLRVIEEPRPGLNVARNAALRAASGEFVALLDDDVSLEPGWLGGLVEVIESGDVDLVSGRTLLSWEDPQTPPWLSPRCEQLLTRLNLGNETREVEKAGEFVGANFAFRRDVAGQIGEFHRSLDRAGSDPLSGGDTEFVGRALRAGFRGMYAPRMAVRHWVAPERVDRGYLARIAHGRGRTRVALALIAGSCDPVGLARVGAAQVLMGIARELRGRVTRDAPEAMEGLLIRKRGMGTLAALMNPSFKRRFATN